MKKITSIIRVCLTVLLIFGVYSEAGIYTTICVSLIYIAIETSSILQNKLRGDHDFLDANVTTMERTLRRAVLEPRYPEEKL